MLRFLKRSLQVEDFSPLSSRLFTNTIVHSREDPTACQLRHVTLGCHLNSQRIITSFQITSNDTTSISDLGRNAKDQQVTNTTSDWSTNSTKQLWDCQWLVKSYSNHRNFVFFLTKKWINSHQSYSVHVWSCCHGSLFLVFNSDLISSAKQLQ